MKKLPLLFLVAGLVCFALLVQSLGLSALFENLEQIGWCMVFVIACELVGDVLTTRGWWYTFSHEARVVPFTKLYNIRLAGAAVNAVTPTAMVGGEVLKAVLLKRYVPLSDGLASVISAKLSLMLGQAVFILVGLGAFLHQLALSQTAKFILVAAFLFTTLGSLWFLHVQRNGLFAWLFRLADRFWLPSTVLSGLRAEAARIDEKLASLHTTRSADFSMSILFHFLAQGLGALQISLLLSWLATPTDFLTCIAVEAFSLLVDGTTFFVPGQVGVQEGGKVVIFTAFGFPASIGLAVGVALRLNQIALILLGLAALAVLRPAKVLVGGTGNKNVYKPTVLTNVKPGMKVVCQEVFAPIVSVIPFKTREDAVALANDSTFGLQAGVFTKDINTAFYFANSLEAGGVWINDSSVDRQQNAPYGGVKMSGLGREGVKYTMEEMSELKFIGIKGPF